MQTLGIEEVALDSAIRSEDMIDVFFMKTKHFFSFAEEAPITGSFPARYCRKDALQWVSDIREKQ